jgi:hypothetical protein
MKALIERATQHGYVAGYAVLLAKANEDLAPDCRTLWQEAQELTLIFSAIVRKVS